MLGSFLLLWDLSPTWSFVSRVQYEQVNVEEIGDGPFTLAWRSMHFLSVSQILCSFTPTWRHHDIQNVLDNITTKVND